MLKQELKSKGSKHLTEDQLSIPKEKLEIGGNQQQERVKMTRLRQTIAKRLKEAQNTAAMLTTYNEIDMSSVMKIQK